MIKQKQLVPNRRFKGFKDEWEERSFEQEVELYSGLTYSPKEVRKKGTFVLRSSNVQHGEIVNADNVYVNSEVVNSSNVRKGDIIVVVRNGSRSLIGKHAQIKEEMNETVIGAFMTGIRANKTNFINALLDTPNFKGEIDKNLGATINQITNSMFKNMNFFLPSAEEQQKIGNFFKHLDEMIALQQRKLDKTKALKSAYLAEMFPAEGERVPKRRFEGFVDEWKIRKIEEVAPLRNGKGFESNNFKNNGVPIIRISNILSTGNIGGKYIYYDEEDNDADYTIPNGAALIAMSGATTGKVSVMKINNYEKVYQNQRVGMFKDLGKANYKYLITLLQSELFESQLMSVLVAGAQPNISSQEINNFEFFFPDNINEQEMIGNFFKNIDNLIATHQQKLDKLKATKQAYLHEMFV